MSRTQVKSSYSFRSLGIAGFVVAVSFFANAVPALAASKFEASDPGNAGAGSSRSVGGSGYGGYYDNYGSKGVGVWVPGGNRSGEGDSSGNTSALKIAELQSRFSQLTEMKDRLEKLLASLKSGGSLPKKPHCAMGQLFTPEMSQRCHNGMSDERGTTTPSPTHCVNNDARRCSDAFRGEASSSPCAQYRNHPTMVGYSVTQSCTDDSGMRPGFGGGNGSSTKNCVGGDPRRCQNAFGRSTSTSSCATGHTMGLLFSSEDIACMRSLQNGTGSVRGASSDMSAEMAEVLGGLTSDLLDLRDTLNQ